MAQNLAQKRTNLLDVRANLPKIFGGLAILGLIAAVIWIGWSFLRPKKPDFVLKGKEIQLSKDVEAVVNGYERRETEGDLIKYYIRADKATIFSDKHQELENVYLEIFDETGEKFDKISANQAIFIPDAADSKLFMAQFNGKVDIETRDGLRVKTEKIGYDRESETAESDEQIEFYRDNISGKSFGAIVKVKEKRLELLREVDLSVTEENDIKNARITAGRAVIEQISEIATFEENVNVSITPQNAAQTDARAEKIVAYFADKKIDKLELNGNVEVSQKPAQVHANSATAFFTDKQLTKIDLQENVEVVNKENGKFAKVNANFATALFEKGLKQVDLRENVQIENAENGRTTKARGGIATAFFESGFQRTELSENVEIDSTNANESPTKIRSQVAIYDKNADKFELKTGVEIITSADNQPTVIHSSEAIYEQSIGKVFLTGGAEITQGSDIIKGNTLTARLFPNKRLKNAVASGNTYLKQVTTERTTEVSSGELTADFNENQQILKAVVKNNAKVSIIPAQLQEYTKVTLSSSSILLSFRPTTNDSVLSQLQTDGRTTINLNAPPNNPNASNKRLTADKVTTVLHNNGKDLQKASAIGNAELYIEPLQASPKNFKTNVTAARFDCDFYETGNNAKSCIANNKAKAVRQPTVSNRNTQTLSAGNLIATFDRNTQDVERFDASGNAKFTEADRNGLANQMTYTAEDETVRLRGGDPTVFDSRARAKAGEIDWDTKNQKSFLRRKVSTTYYSQKATGGATPFTATNSPVYLTAESANFDHQREVGIYSGNARAWQENNYVRADELVIYQKEQRFEGTGNVQSLLYNVKRKEGGKVTNQAVSASAEKIAYSDDKKHLRYENRVDIRQGAERILSGVADIYLDANNEVRQTIVENEVVITAPNRRVRGTWAQYTTADETVILRGNPATVEDAQQGTTQGSQLTVAMRENRVVNQGAKPGGTGRTRTVYKVKNQ
jgi:lipopolysaccharide export system protein LptA